MKKNEKDDKMFENNEKKMRDEAEGVVRWGAA